MVKFRTKYVNTVGFSPEEVDTEDLECLDTESITSVKGFIERFQADKSFAPPETTMSYDTELGPIDIDKDVAPEFGYDFDDALEDDNSLKTRAQD